MGKNKRLFIDCSKAKNCCDKSQYKEAGNLERLKMILHLSFCATCRAYTFRNTRLTKLLKKAKLKTCTKDQKKSWKEQIEKEMTK